MADQRKADLIAQLDRARSQAAAQSRALTEDLQVGDKLKESIGRNRGAWISGAVLTGLVISKLPGRTQKVVVDRQSGKSVKEIEQVGKIGLVLSALKFVFTLVRPMVTKWLTQRLTQGRSLRSSPRYTR